MLPTVGTVFMTIFYRLCSSLPLNASIKTEAGGQQTVGIPPTEMPALFLDGVSKNFYGDLRAFTLPLYKAR